MRKQYEKLVNQFLDMCEDREYVPTSQGEIPTLGIIDWVMNKRFVLKLIVKKKQNGWQPEDFDLRDKKTGNGWWGVPS